MSRNNPSAFTVRMKAYLSTMACGQGRLRPASCSAAKPSSRWRSPIERGRAVQKRECCVRPGSGSPFFLSSQGTITVACCAKRRHCTESSSFCSRMIESLRCLREGSRAHPSRSASATADEQWRFERNASQGDCRPARTRHGNDTHAAPQRGRRVELSEFSEAHHDQIVHVGIVSNEDKRAARRMPRSRAARAGSTR